MYAFKRKKVIPYLFMTPIFSLLSFTLIIPIMYSIWLSFNSYDIGKGSTIFIGLSNYFRLFTDPYFWKAVKVSVIFMVACMSLEFIFGTGIALLLKRKFKYRSIIRGLFLLPIMIAPVAVGLQWKWMYNYTFGIINYFLQYIGIAGRTWLTDFSTARWAVIVANVWYETPFVILFMLAGLESLPTELSDAAKIDGASKLQEFTYITLPILKPVILIVLLMTSIFTFRIFDLVYILTGGGPANYTQPIAVYTYKQAFSFWHFAYAASSACFMLLVLAIIGIFYIKIMK